MFKRIQARLAETALSVPELEADSTYIVSKTCLVYGPFDGRKTATDQARIRHIAIDYVIEGADLAGTESYTARWRSGELQMASL